MQTQEKLLTVDEVVERLPFSVTRETVYRWIRERKLASKRYIGRYFVPESSVEKLLTEGDV